MYPRLVLARELISDDGVIFISIDDNEYANLKLICDEIFGEENFISTLKWKKKRQPSFLSTVANIMEYVLAYSKNRININKLIMLRLYKLKLLKCWSRNRCLRLHKIESRSESA